MRKLILILSVLMLVTGGMLITGQAAAQDDSFDIGESTREISDGGGSFASAFFISKKFVPGSEEKRVEVLGSFIIWFLLLLSIGSIGLIGHMALTNQRKSILPVGVHKKIKALLEKNSYNEAIELAEREQSFFSQVLGATLRESNLGFTAMLRRLEQISDELTTERLRRIEYLNVLGQVSPMIGLFGTVYGMIVAFQSIVVAGGNADPVLLAGGIGTALTTTFWGLVVAIPALAGYAVLRNQIDALTAEATIAAEELLSQFRPAGETPPKPMPAKAKPRTKKKSN